MSKDIQAFLQGQQEQQHPATAPSTNPSPGQCVGAGALSAHSEGPHQLLPGQNAALPAYSWCQDTPKSGEMERDRTTTPLATPDLPANHSIIPRKAGGQKYTTLQPLTGLPVMRTAYLHSLPEYAYIMPAGPTLRFTLADLFVFLPTWFKNVQIATRALNNRVSSNVHFEILQEHRVLNIPEAELSRLKDVISDNYRRTMRRSDNKWTKASHKTPEDWNPNDISVNNFVPDGTIGSSFQASQARLTVPLSRPVPFMDLMKDVTKIPEGPDSGDLTRAVEFAVNNPKQGPNGEVLDWVFPTDIHAILNHIGYTNITVDHLDAAAVIRYSKKVRESASADRKRRRDLEAAGLPVPAPKRRHVAKGMVPEQVAPQADMAGPMHQPFSQDIFLHQQALRSLLPATVGPQSSQLQDGGLLPPMITVTEPTPPSQPIVEAESFGHSADVVLPAGQVPGDGITPSEGRFEGAEHMFSFGMDDVEFHDIDELIAASQEYDFSDLFSPVTDPLPYLEPDPNDMGAPMETVDLQYSWDFPLRDCVEADDYEDLSDLARAARWCRDPDNLASHYTVCDAYFVLGLMGMMEDAEQLGSVAT
jgi:hypothetical protein